MLQPHEIISVQNRTIGCDGGGAGMGHPLVYLTVWNSDHIDCPYCSRRFVLDEQAKTAAGH